ncbi:arsenic transporter [Fructilactobacillus lindneri]|nr:arsenic transporter [Fructilactobacillus lindneri]POG97774.1 arsenic transporter [Fructilactobacillus lindneri]
MKTILAIFIFVVTLIFVIWQPKKLSIGWPTSIGAIAVLALGVVNLNDVNTVIGIVWNATLAFIAIIIISLTLDEIGFFKWAALHLARLANGNGTWLFTLILTFGALVAAFFANDGAALILTPIVIEIMRALQFDKKDTFPFIIACGFIADATSLPFVISNLINIISANFFNISFGSYAMVMIIPDLFALMSSLGILYWYFRKSIPKHYKTDLINNPADAIVSKKLFKLSWLVLLILLIGYFLSGPLNIPVSIIALPIALIFLFICHKNPKINAKKVIKGAPWNIVIFSIGMYVVVYGLQNIGLINILSTIIKYLASLGTITANLGMGFLAALLSSVMNNLPATMIDALSIKAAGQTGIMHQTLVYANIIGSDLGPKLTPIGSLATLVWLQVLGKQGIKIGWKKYCQIGVVITFPVLLITLLGLALSLFIFKS